MDSIFFAFIYRQKKDSYSSYHVQGASSDKSHYQKASWFSDGAV